jgi:S-adenosylmethionine-diacylglycerol 3-amino-3-carboxypropyl transferase
MRRGPFRYTSVNEDWRTEATAIAPDPADTILCVTGSGARPLDVLALSPRRVVAVDVDPAQSALLELKAAAIRPLSFEAYSRFLGLHSAPARERLAVFESLLPDLSPAAARLLGAHRADVARGLLYRGRWERYFRAAGLVARALRPGLVPRLFSFDDVSAQRRFVAERWDTRFGRLLTGLALSGPVTRLLLRDLAFTGKPCAPAGRFVSDRMTAHLSRVLARESFMASLVLRGELPDADLPPHLTPEGFATIRQHLDRLQVVTADVVELLDREGETERFDAFSLSDVPSYLTADSLARLLDGVVRRAAPDARFCIRLFLVRPPFPEPFPSRLVRDTLLEHRLAEEDHAFAYDFVAGRIAPA